MIKTVFAWKTATRSGALGCSRQAELQVTSDEGETLERCQHSYVMRNTEEETGSAVPPEK